MKPNAGFSLIEVLICLAVMALVALIFYPQLTNAKEQADLTAARGQAKQLQSAMDSWLLKRPLATARTSFAPTTSDYPTDTGALLAELKVYLSEESKLRYSVSSTDNTMIVTDIMEENGWSMRLRWTGANWLSEHPRVEFLTP